MQQKHVKKISSSGKLTSWLFTKRKELNSGETYTFMMCFIPLKNPLGSSYISFLCMYLKNNKAFINTRVAKN